jgi:hypothetical protein
MTRIFGFLGILTIAAMMFAPYAIGTPEMAKKESKSCTFCHTGVGKPELNDAGKYYRDHNNSLEGFTPKK